MSKRLVGTYVSVDEAMREVERLKDQGYGRDDIEVVADKAVRNSIPFTMDAEVVSTEEAKEEMRDDERSFWEKLKDAFTFNEYTDEGYSDPTMEDADDPLQEYRNDLAAGKVVVLVEDDDGKHIPPTDPILKDNVPMDPLMRNDNMRNATTPDLTTNDMRTDPPLENDDFVDRDPRNLP
ncbi:general stress protein [Jeotgalibaca sp. A122]|uniref:general stress protein n=1 Tax=Jeotgalibaca sp. A122 TaxID=3457322 RepID=UPI003FD68C84